MRSHAWGNFPVVTVFVVLFCTWEIRVLLDLIQKRSVKRYVFSSGFVLITPSSEVIIDTIEF